MKTLPPFLSELPQWQGLIKGRHVIFDTNAIVAILKYKAEDILEQFSMLEITPCIIHPVFIELINTNNVIERTSRQAMLDKYNFFKLPLLEGDLKNASRIQIWLAANDCYPGPTDIYLGAKLASFAHDNIVLLSGNISDFPFPLFTRSAVVLLQNNKHTQALHFLSIDHDELDTAA